MGHWWKEGPVWLREVLGLLGDEMQLPSRVAEKALAGKPAPHLSPPDRLERRRDLLNLGESRHAGDMAQNHAEEDLLERRHSEGRAAERALLQAARELLLTEASDWTFMITRDEAAAYARDRFESHLDATAHNRHARRGDIDLSTLSALEETDNPFPWLKTDYW